MGYAPSGTGPQVRKAGQRIGGEARLGLLAVADDGRSGLLKALDGIANCLVIGGGKFRVANLATVVCGHRAKQSRTFP
jgi:hypothetical protein